MIMKTTRKATREELAKRVDELQEKLDKKDKEIETWKKIAEKLAERAGDYGIIPKCEKCSYEDSHECIECIIDWARKEVEKDDSGNDKTSN